jgi:Flp pilus assembly protein TadG
MNPQDVSMRKLTGRRLQQERGQTLLLFILFMIVLFLFVGLGIDFGFAYISKAKLSKAVDAACLAGMRNLAQGQTQAALVASNAIAANYGSSGRDVAPPTPQITFSVVNGNTVIDVKASVDINTFFLRALPAMPFYSGASWKTLTVGSSAEATRAKLIMTLVLDVSGSMDPSRAPRSLGGDGTGSGGGIYLPNAVTTFINNFDDTNDVVAMVKFSTIQANVIFGGSPPQPIQPFKQKIINAVNAFTWNGATFSQGGLTNGLVLENNATLQSGQNYIKVVVFATDGLANVVQDDLNCPPTTLVNFGGYDSGTGVGLFDPTTGNSISCGASSFTPADPSDGTALVRANVSQDAEYRAVQVADDMRAGKIIVYSIGVGSGINLQFLRQVANDPALAGTAGYTATSYDGEAVVANDVSQLAPVFQTIASKILLRLTK